MRTLLIALLICTVAGFAQDQAPTGGRPTGGRIDTATRGVVKYRGLEKELVQAGQAKDQQSIDRLVAQDFEVWSAERNQPTPRTDWVREWISQPAGLFDVRDMAVHDFGDIAVVSFLLDRRGPGQAHLPTIYVVDIWRQSSGKLAVRYISTPENPAPPQLVPTGKR